MRKLVSECEHLFLINVYLLLRGLALSKSCHDLHYYSEIRESLSSVL